MGHGLPVCGKTERQLQSGQFAMLRTRGVKLGAGFSGSPGDGLSVDLDLTIGFCSEAEG